MSRDEAIRLATLEAGPDRELPSGWSFGWRLTGARLVEVPEGGTMPVPYWSVWFDETFLKPGSKEQPTRHGGLVVDVSCSTGETKGWNLL